MVGVCRMNNDSILIDLARVKCAMKNTKDEQKRLSFQDEYVALIRMLR